MRTKLLKSFLVVFLFWWVLSAISWSFADPSTNLLALQRVARLVSFVGVHLEEVPRSISILDALKVQLRILHVWVIPVTLVTLVMAAIGAVVVWFKAVGAHQERSQRIAKSEEYRGVSCSLGPLPAPGVPQAATISLRGAGDRLAALTEAERALLSDVLSIVAGNQEAFAGENQPAGSILKQAIAGVTAALNRTHRPGLAAIAAAATELGKITSWKKDEEGAWVRFRHEARESARILAALPTWFALPSTDRLALLFAVKYRSQPDQIPELARDPQIYRLARTLIEAEGPLVATPAAAVQELSQKAFEAKDPEAELLEVFERELSMLPFQSPGLPKNIPAAGWKRNGLEYLLENRLVESLLPKLSVATRTALAPGGRDKAARISVMTATLLKVFHERGWLVTEHGKDKVSPQEAMWVITAGKLEFSRAIILNLPAELKERLPARDSLYEVTVKRPLFQSVIQSAVSKDDLMGGLLRPKAASAKAPDVKGAADAKATPEAQAPESPAASEPLVADKPAPAQST